MAIELDKQIRDDLVESIQRYFRENLDEDIGDLKASLMLDFCLAELGPTIYNKAILDAQAWIQERVGDLDGSCWEPEVSYWNS